MRKIGTDIRKAVEHLAGSSSEVRKSLRVHQVRSRYKQALEAVYHDSAALFLEHTNNVYILGKAGIKTLIVYVDESIFAAELNAQRELIKLKLLELFGEDVEDFEIHVSRGTYRDNHPYAEDIRQNDGENSASVPLDAAEKAAVSNAVSKIEDAKLRATFEKAMTADLEWKKGKRGEILEKGENQAF